ncbi:MAG: disulfide bond formation protein B [Pseudomonadota bacterium]
MFKSRVSVRDPSSMLALCVGFSAALILGAHLFERVGHLAPCALCLDQREAHWAALGTGLATLLAARVARAPSRLLAAALGAVALIYMFSALLAGYHAGVEWSLWPGPATCSAGQDVSLATGADLLRSLSERGSGPACSDAPWRFAGISMAGYNAVISFILATIAAISCRATADGLMAERVNAAALAE